MRGRFMPTDADPRAGLFAGRKAANGSGNNGSGGGETLKLNERTDETLLEQENDALVQNLHDKVDFLKKFSIEIGDEVREQNKFLKGFDDDMSTSGNLMSSTLHKLDSVMGTGGSKHLCYLVLFIFVFFMLVVWLVRR